MNILILGLNYLPELTSIGPYTAGLAEYLNDRGHKVRVITGFPTAPQWKVWDGYRGRRFMHEVLNGVKIFRTYLYVPKHPRKASRRILFDCSFALSALAGILSRPRPDLVLVISPPLQLAVTGRLMASIGRARVFLHIQDLVPDAAVAVGALNQGSAVLKLGRRLEQWAYKGSAGISVICEGMRRNLVAKGVPEDKVMVLPNYVDMDLVRPIPENNQFRGRFGIDPRAFLVIYTGSVAGKQGLQTFLEAAAAFENGANITCCIFGDGAYLPELKQLAERLALKRFQFFPIQSRETLAPMMSAADVLIITQRKEVTDMVFPGKLLYYMSAGTAVLAAVNADSETGRFISEHKVGLVVPPETPQALAEAIRWLSSHPNETAEFGRNGRRMVETQFDRSIVLRNFAARLERCGAER